MLHLHHCNAVLLQYLRGYLSWNHHIRDLKRTDRKGKREEDQYPVVCTGSHLPDQRMLGIIFLIEKILLNRTTFGGMRETIMHTLFSYSFETNMKQENVSLLFLFTYFSLFSCFFLFFISHFLPFLLYFLFFFVSFYKVGTPIALYMGKDH